MKSPDCRRIEEEEPVSLQYFLKKKFQLIGMEGTRLLRESASKGDPAGAKRRGGSRTARGKRVPGVEILTHPLLQKSAPFPPTACQVLITEVKRACRSFIIEREFPQKIRRLPFARLRMKAV
ncbi:hypothetical protein H7T43_17385 [Peribacillus simplex]|nr:hypothetical protein [Peribacillus simplex]